MGLIKNPTRQWMKFRVKVKVQKKDSHVINCCLFLLCYSGPVHCVGWKSRDCDNVRKSLLLLLSTVLTSHYFNMFIAVLLREYIVNIIYRRCQKMSWLSRTICSRSLVQCFVGFFCRVFSFVRFWAKMSLILTWNIPVKLLHVCKAKDPESHGKPNFSRVSQIRINFSSDTFALSCKVRISIFVKVGSGSTFSPALEYGYVRSQLWDPYFPKRSDPKHWSIVYWVSQK